MLKLGQFAILGLYLCNSELHHYPLEPPRYFKEKRKGTLCITQQDGGDEKKVYSKLSKCVLKIHVYIYYKTK